jgi:hypothetical protein
MLGRLRIAASVFFAIMAVAMCALWVRSYAWAESVHCNPFGSVVLGASSINGRVGIGVSNTAPGAKSLLTRHSIDIRAHAMSVSLEEVYSEFYLSAGLGVHSRGPGDFVLLLPSWFMLGLMSTLAVVSWPRRTYRFSLRTMLIATTVAAIALGVIVVLSR